MKSEEQIIIEKKRIQHLYKTYPSYYDMDEIADILLTLAWVLDDDKKELDIE